eukprot:c238_g1_i1 orf=186-2897(+)
MAVVVPPAALNVRFCALFWAIFAVLCSVSGGDVIGYGYRVASVTGNDVDGLEAVLEVIQTSTTYGEDIPKLSLQVSYETNNRLHVHITDNDNARWEVPQTLIPRGQEGNSRRIHKLAKDNIEEKPASSELQFSHTDDPFGFAITRKSSGEVLFNSTPSSASSNFNAMIFKDQYLEISTSLPTNSALYGLGESTRPDGFRLSQGNTYTLWNSDIASSTPNINLYGSLPFYLDVREGGLSHGVLLLNSNGMDVTYQSGYLTYKVIGGVLDFYFFAGSSPLSVVDQYTQVVGRPAPMPYWSLGFHQCRWGYKNIADITTVVNTYREKDIPLEVMWNDIDYMDNYKDFTVDPVNYPASELRKFVDQLHANDQRYVIIIDPGIKNENNYSTFQHGMSQDIFIKETSGDPYLAQVWPGPVYFPDFLNPKINSFWTTEISNFQEVIPFDGLWTDMNEASNFCSGVTCAYPTDGACPGTSDLTDCCLVCSNDGATKWDAPPYQINNSNDQRPLGNKTIATSAIHSGGIMEYNAHNLYGLSEAIATNMALKSSLGKRPFILTRSTFVGSGAYAAHWTGDNAATWNDLAYSIVSIMNSGLFGVPMVGADICGFSGDTSEELCNRWIQVGAFYPFTRDHSDIDSTRQELYIWDTVAQSARDALGLRYRLLPYLYTLIYEAHTTGAPVARPLFFSFPQDATTLGVNSQFLLGQGVLVSPVLSSGATSVSAYFPKGTWYNLFNLSQIVSVEDGSYQNLAAPLETINVHVHEGSILPMQDAALTTTAARKTPFTLLVVFPLASDSTDTATGHLFMDDGEEIDMEVATGKSTVIDFEASRSNEGIHISSTVTSPDFALNGGWTVQTVTVLGSSSSPSNILINGNPASSSLNVTVSYPVVEISGLSLPIGNPFKISWET